MFQVKCPWLLAATARWLPWGSICVVLPQVSCSWRRHLAQRAMGALSVHLSLCHVRLSPKAVILHRELWGHYLSLSCSPVTESRHLAQGTMGALSVHVTVSCSSVTESCHLAQGTMGALFVHLSLCLVQPSPKVWFFCFECESTEHVSTSIAKMFNSYSNESKCWIENKTRAFICTYMFKSRGPIGFLRSTLALLLLFTCVSFPFVSICPPDMTFAVDLVLKNNYLSILFPFYQCTTQLVFFSSSKQHTFISSSLLTLAFVLFSTCVRFDLVNNPEVTPCGWLVLWANKQWEVITLEQWTSHMALYSFGA